MRKHSGLKVRFGILKKIFNKDQESILKKKVFIKDQEPILQIDFSQEKIVPLLSFTDSLIQMRRKKKNGDKLRNFTQVRVEDKRTNLIIDDGRAINFVAQEVIDKLHWPTQKLHKPYQVTQSNGHVIPVTHRYLVSFKMGHYEGKIWCDVIYMNIAHYFWASMAF